MLDLLSLAADSEKFFHCNTPFCAKKLDLGTKLKGFHGSESVDYKFHRED